MEAYSQSDLRSKFGFKTLHKVMMLLLTPLHLLLLVVGGYVIWIALGLLAKPSTLEENHTVFETVVLFAIPFCVLIPLGLGMIISRVYILTLKWGMALLSYVIVSPDGLEVRQWPSYRDFYTWDNIERDKMTNAFGKGKPAFHLKNGDELPEDRWTTRMRLRWLTGSSQIWRDRFSPGGYEGYPNGELANALKRYAPHLFE